MVRSYLKVLLIILFLLLSFEPAYATIHVTKEKAPYEITKMTFDQHHVILEGWAVVMTDQHFMDESTHRYIIELTSVYQTKRYQTSLLPVSKTTLLEYRGKDYCANNVYDKEQYECNYFYEHVGFKAMIPLEDIQLDQVYIVSIIIETKNTHRKYRLPMYVPQNQPIIHQVGDIRYQATSSLKDTQLKVTFSTVVARSGPSTIFPVATAGDSCSSTYGNRLYYKQFTVFKKPLDQFFDGTTTHYKLSGKPDICINSRRTVVEGDTVNPIWIASVFVDYSGTPLTLQAKLINTAPWLDIIHPTFTLKEDIKLLDYVSAYDLEEGNISDRIHIINQPDFSQSGIYPVYLEVMDVYGEKASGTMYVTILDPINLPPHIHTVPPTIMQYSVYNYKNYVFAYDTEDGDISHLVIALNELTTEKPGIFEQCFTVMDSHGSISHGCMDVTIVPYHSTNTDHHRFISIYVLETLTNPWKSYIHDLMNQLTSKAPLIQKRLK